ncbi:hypothetical protein N9954_00975 [Maribacter sp.]|nr:hypothetical protein [Maribacter sp.]
MDLKPKIGVDKLKFGMSQKDIFEILGSPDRKRIDEDDDDLLLLEYNKIRLRLTIYLNEQNRLGYMRTSNPDLMFNGNRIIGSQIDLVKKDIFGKIIDTWEVEEHDFFITHSNDNVWLTLDEEFGTVTNVEVGVTFLNGEDYDWPL